MSILWDVIEEEAHRLEELIPFYLEKIESYPKGYLNQKKRGSKVYLYLNHREKNRVISKYIGPLGGDAANGIEEAIEKRHKLEEFLSVVRKNLKEVKNVVRDAENGEIFLRVLRNLKEKEILDDFILIGGWCLYFYREYFKSSQVPVYRTADMDFLIPRPLRIQKEADMSIILAEMGFEIKGNSRGYTKYVRPELEVEFLVPELGRGSEAPYEVKPFKINAVSLRYLNLLQGATMTASYDGLKVRIPEPAAFALHKYILSTIRHHSSKKAPKDLQTAQELSRFLLSRDDQRETLQLVYAEMPKGWKKKLNGIVQEHHPELFSFLTGS